MKKIGYLRGRFKIAHVYKKNEKIKKISYRRENKEEQHDFERKTEEKVYYKR